MKRNVGSKDRLLRALGGAAMATCTVMAPLPIAVRVATFGILSVYMLFTAVAGTCFGYSLMGKSTFPVEPGR